MRISILCESNQGTEAATQRCHLMQHFRFYCFVSNEIVAAIEYEWCQRRNQYRCCNPIVCRVRLAKMCIRHIYNHIKHQRQLPLTFRIEIQSEIGDATASIGVTE